MHNRTCADWRNAKTCKKVVDKQAGLCYSMLARRETQNHLQKNLEKNQKKVLTSKTACATMQSQGKGNTKTVNQKKVSVSK